MGAHSQLLWGPMLPVNYPLLHSTMGAKKIDAKTKKSANIEKAVTFFLEEIEQKFKQMGRGN